MNSSSKKKILEAELRYREGNLLYNQGEVPKAETSWENSTFEENSQTEQSSAEKSNSSPPYIRTIGAVLLTAVCFYARSVSTELHLEVKTGFNNSGKISEI